MNYGFKNGAATQAPENFQPVLQTNLNLFQSYNQSQNDTLNLIEQKLNSIYNKRATEKSEQNNSPEVPIADIAQQYNMEIQKLYYQNQRLEKILQHLNEIV